MNISQGGDTFITTVHDTKVRVEIVTANDIFWVL
jgi:hypothetical protein